MRKYRQSLDLFKHFHDVQIILTIPQELNGDGHNEFIY